MTEKIEKEKRRIGVFGDDALGKDRFSTCYDAIRLTWPKLAKGFEGTVRGNRVANALSAISHPGVRPIIGPDGVQIKDDEGNGRFDDLHRELQPGEQTLFLTEEEHKYLRSAVEDDSIPWNFGARSKIEDTMRWVRSWEIADVEVKKA